VIKSASGMGM